MISNSGYNAPREGLLIQAVSGLLDGISSLINKRTDREDGVAPMFLTDRLFNVSSREGADFYERSASLDLSSGFFEKAAAPAEGFGALDALVDRAAGISLGFNRGAGKEEQMNMRLHSNLEQAFVKAKGHEGRTVKLNDRDMTTASGQGVRRTGQQISSKEESLKVLKGATSQLRKEGTLAPAAEKAGASGGSKLGKMATNFAATTAIGLVAEAIVPGGGTAVAIASVGAGSFGARGAGSEFKSAADRGSDSVYGVTSGHNAQDIMGKPATSGVDINAMMQNGPGFGHLPSIVEFETSPSLADTKVMFGEEEVAALEAQCRIMEEDVQLGRTMFERHLDADVAVTESFGGIPLTELKVDEEDEAMLMSDNPVYYREALSAATFNPRALN